MHTNSGNIDGLAFYIKQIFPIIFISLELVYPLISKIDISQIKKNMHSMKKNVYYSLFLIGNFCFVA